MFKVYYQSPEGETVSIKSIVHDNSKSAVKEKKELEEKTDSSYLVINERTGYQVKHE